MENSSRVDSRKYSKFLEQGKRDFSLSLSPRDESLQKPPGRGNPKVNFYIIFYDLKKS